MNQDAIPIKLPYLPQRDQWLREILPNHRHMFDLACRSHEAALGLITAGDPLPPDLPKNLSLCLIGVTVKQIRLFSAIVDLCANGMSVEAAWLLRASFELVVNQKCLEVTTDRTKFAIRWLLWVSAGLGPPEPNVTAPEDEKKALAEQWHKPYEETRAEIAAEAIAEAKKSPKADPCITDQDVADQAWKNFRRWGPVMKPIEQKCIIADDGNPGKTMHVLYDLLYRQTSPVGHAADLSTHAIPLEEGGIEARFIPRDDGLRGTIVTAMGFLRITIQLTNNLLLLKKDAIVAQIIDCEETARSLVKQS